MTLLVPMRLLRHLGIFTLLEAKSCIFAFSVLALLWLTQHFAVPGIARYDLMLFACLSIQALMLWFKLETWDEAKTIALFHVVGLGLELFKVRMGSWSYPEAALFKFWGVPLYSGFMYASVGSYICQAWRNFDLRLNSWPPEWQVITVTSAAYLNFFSLHFGPDFRWPLIAMILWIFRKVRVSFQVAETRYRMPLVGSYACIGTMIWIAENIGTRVGGWMYPNQAQTWTMVNFAKIGSWSLMVIISVVLVAQLKRVKEQLSDVPAAAIVSE